MIHPLFTAYKQHLSLLPLKQIAYHPAQQQLASPAVTIQFPTVPLSIERTRIFKSNLELIFHLHHADLQGSEERAEGDHLQILDDLLGHLQGFSTRLREVAGYEEEKEDYVLINSTDVLEVSPGHQGSRNLSHQLRCRAFVRYKAHKPVLQSATPNPSINEQ